MRPPPASHASERIVRDDHRSRLFGDQLVDIAQQRTPAREHYAPIRHIAAQIRRRFSSACLTALTIPCKGSSRACMISFEFNVKPRGTPLKVSSSNGDFPHLIAGKGRTDSRS